MKLTRLQFEERLRQASPGDTIVVYVASATRHDAYTVKSVKGRYIYIKHRIAPVHFDHVEELRTPTESWERK